MADKSDKSDKKDKKDSKKKGKEGADATMSVAEHPRAAAAIRRSKGVGGLLGFALAGFLAHQAGLSPARTLERALIAGVAGYVIAWACALTVWRQIIAAQLRAVAARRASAAPSRRTLSLGAAAQTAPSSPAAPAAPASDAPAPAAAPAAP